MYIQTTSFYSVYNSDQYCCNSMLPMLKNIIGNLIWLVFISTILLSACTTPATIEPGSTPTSTLPGETPLTTSIIIPSIVTPTDQSPSSTQPLSENFPSTTITIQSCSPTRSDALGPFYTPGAPFRDKVGEGYQLTGTVRSAQGCVPIPGAQIELWMAGPDSEYRDEYRATIYSDENGIYTFESHFPPPYSGRPPHHHLLISAEGFQGLVTQHYPAQGEDQATFDLVLLPAD